MQRCSIAADSVRGHLVLLVLVFFSWRIAVGQPQQAKTDPTEAAALNTILGRWGKPASPSDWNTTGDPCSGKASDPTDWDNYPGISPFIKCDCSYNNHTVCHITKLRVNSLDVVGQIPTELQNLTKLVDLNLQNNYLTGAVPSFIGKITSLIYLTLSFNALSGPLPKELGNLTNLLSLGIGVNNFTGELPEELGNLTKLQQMYIDSSGFSGPFPSFFSKLKNLQILKASDNEFTGKLPDYLGSLTNLQRLVLHGNSFEGPIPASLSNLINLRKLQIGDLVNGSSSLAFISNMKSLGTLMLRNCRILADLGSVDFSSFQALMFLDLSFNSITGQIPQSILKLGTLEFLFLGNNSLTGSLPNGISTKLKVIDFSYNQLSGRLPSWVIQNNLKLNLVANNFVLDSNSNSILRGLECLQQDAPCFRGSPEYYSFAVDCGSNRSMKGLHDTIYEADFTDLGAASYYVTEQTRWGVSSVGKFIESGDVINIINTSEHFKNSVDLELFENARISSSSLKYYGLGLENGNYTVLLQFAELIFPDSQTWKSLGRRVFDIYIQGALKEKDFDIREAAGGKSFTPVNRSYTINVSKNFLEIHLFWAGKGTCCVPNKDYNGPMISALSVTPNFIPTVRNGVPKRGHKALFTGILVGALAFGLLALFAISMLLKKQKTMAQQKNELYALVGRQDVFSNSELKQATNNFSSQNILGEGGYGTVYKGKLIDGRVIAVKQLSQSSHQGKAQFVTEVATISAVQHRNLVKLHGFCVDSKVPLLVYEYLDNGSLDRALFGASSLKLDWQIRYEIILGIARGLTYIHEESSMRIVHRDIKASNILLDSDLTPKISDFGLAKLYNEKQTHLSTRVAGTLGYLAPEYAMRGHLSEKADVFAFGVVVLETIAGRSNTDNSLEESKIYLFEWAWGLYEKGQSLAIVDPRLQEYNKGEAYRAICVALHCTQGSPQLRPPMSKVVAMLTGEVDVAKVVSKPSYITESLLRDGNGSFGTSSYSGFTTSDSTNPGLSRTIIGASHEGW